jgi:hypothetical protein
MYQINITSNLIRLAFDLVLDRTNTSTTPSVPLTNYNPSVNSLQLVSSKLWENHKGQV